MLTRRKFISAVAASSVITPALLRAATNGFTYVGWSQDEAANKAALGKIFQQFQQVDPSAAVKVVGFPYAQMQQNLFLRLRAHQPVDAAQLTLQWLPQFGATGKMLDFNDVYGRAALEKVIDPAILRLGQVKGKQLSMPWTAGSIGMVANAAVLKEAGISQAPVTIDAFVESLKAVKAKFPEAVPYAMSTKDNASMASDFQTWLWTFGGHIFNDQGQVAVNSPAGVRALGFMSDLVKDRLAAKDTDRYDARRLFAQNRCAFYQDAPLARGFARDNSGKGTAFDANVVSIATPVLAKGDVPRSFAWGHLLASFAQDKKSFDVASAPARFVSYLSMTDEPQLEYFHQVGLFPVTKSAIAKLSVDPYVANWTKSAKSATRDELTFYPNVADLTVIVGEQVQAAVLGQKTAAQAIDDMSKRLSDAIV
jgi:multiple sugar transport system substrate-binding protein